MHTTNLVTSLLAILSLSLLNSFTRAGVVDELKGDRQNNSIDSYVLLTGRVVRVELELKGEPSNKVHLEMWTRFWMIKSGRIHSLLINARFLRLYVGFYRNTVEIKVN